MKLETNACGNLRRQKSQQGMTFVEVILVLVILGLVMTWLGNRLFKAGDKAKATLTQLKMKDLQTSIEQFQLRYNKLPSSFESLVQCTEETGEGCTPITERESLKDAWGNPFVYAIENSGRSYKIKCLGADGKDGGDGINYDFTVTGP